MIPESQVVYPWEYVNLRVGPTRRFHRVDSFSPAFSTSRMILRAASKCDKSLFGGPVELSLYRVEAVASSNDDI